MSMRTLGAAILRGARAIFRNPKLRQKDILEWGTGMIQHQHGEIVEHIPDPGVYVAILAKHDKRKGT